MSGEMFCAIAQKGGASYHMGKSTSYHEIQSLVIRSFMLIQISQTIGSIDYLKAQSLPTTDVFPLGKHYTWTYGYQYSQHNFDNFGEGGSTFDSGNVIFSIRDSSMYGDSISWQIHMERNLHIYSKTCLGVSSCEDTTFTVIDSSDFLLWESVLGNHHIYLDDNNNGIRIWSFIYQFPDSEQIFRYQLVGSQGVSILNTSSPGYFAVDMPIQFTFKKDSGLTNISGTINYEKHGASINCYLLNATLTSVKQYDAVTSVPSEYHLYPNYPNPYNPGTAISFSLPRSSFVTIKIYNLLGQLINTLVNERRAPGTYNVQFNAYDLPSGVYYYKLSAGDFVQTRSMLVVK